MPNFKKSNKRQSYKSKIIQALALGSLSEKELLSKLKVPSSCYKAFYREIKGLLQEKVLFSRDKRYTLLQKEKKVIGTLSVHPRGFGFVSPRNKKEFSKDVFIPRKFMKGAVDEDLVEVEIKETPSKKGFEGKISQIIKRGKKRLLGTVTLKTNKGYLLFVPSLKEERSVLLKETKESLQKGDRVVVNICSWGGEKGPIQTSLERKIGSIFEAKTDTIAALQEFSIEENFPEEVKDQAKKWGLFVREEDKKDRVDYTRLNTITIDPKTAKDFDDAISLEKEASCIHLYVHIADVAHYVKSGSKLDKKAFERANSTYFPGKCIPMLPESLSNGLCSLKPDVIRLAVTVKMSFSLEGDLLEQKIERSFILSKKRFSYEEAFAVLQNREKSSYLPLLKDLVFLCMLLKKKRQERGSIEFALPEAQILLDENESPRGIEIHEYDITHQMIEEFMLKANEVVATTLHKKGLSLIFRVHQSPSSESLEDFYQTVRILGFSLPNSPSTRDLQKLFLQAKDSPFFHRLSVAFIRSMKLALYSPDNIGHYGLALTHYTHFTSPIRRYSDLVISRLLFQEPFEGDLAKIAKHCSEKERVSMKAEQNVVFLKKLRLLRGYFKENPKRTYKATITKIKPSHLFFELDDFFFEGSFSFSDIDVDYFEFIEEKALWLGSKKGISLAQGDKLLVGIKTIDLIHQEAFFLFYNLV